MSKKQSSRKWTPVPRKYVRRWLRRDVRIATKVEILLRDGRVFTTGTAIIRNISLQGALLGRFVMKNQAFPAKQFRLRLNFQSKEYEGIGALCRPARFGAEESFELAVLFEDFWARTDEKKKRTAKIALPPKTRRKRKK